MPSTRSPGPAVFTPCAIGSAAQLSPGTRTKQGSPVHFVAGFFQAIAPYAQRMRRKDRAPRHIRRAPCRSSSSPHMHAPERAKRNRTVVRTHAVAISPRSLGSLRRPVLRLPFRLFPAQFLQIFRTLAQILRVQQMARSKHQRCYREVAAAAIVLRIQSASIPNRNMRGPGRVVGLCPGTARRHR
jgi:hypothetical protein